MQTPLSIAEHLAVEEVERRYRRAPDGVARGQWQIRWLLAVGCWLLAGGQSTAPVAATTGYSQTWMRTVAQRYNAAGPAGGGDRRHRNPGAKRLLTREQEQELDQALDGLTPDGGQWTCQKVADWMGQRVGRQLDARRGREMLRRLRFGRGKPRPPHAKADAAAQTAFNKGGAPPTGERRARGASHRGGGPLGQ